MPKYILVDSDGKVVKTGTLSANNGSNVITEIDYNATQNLVLWVGGANGSMGYKVGTATSDTKLGYINMNYCEFTDVGNTIRPTNSTTKITFSLTVNVLV